MTDQTNKLFECYVAHSSHDEAVEIIERLIANGAKAYEAVIGMGIEAEYYYTHDIYECWGYSPNLGTYSNNRNTGWTKHSKQLTMQEFRDAFPCEKYDSTTKEWLQSGDRVVVTEDEVKSDAIFIGKSPSGAYVCQMSSGWAQCLYDDFHRDQISKPKSDREKFIEAATRVANSVPNDARLCDIQAMMGKLYDADFKSPENK